jgi:hypothetical protein
MVHVEKCIELPGRDNGLIPVNGQRGSFIVFYLRMSNGKTKTSKIIPLATLQQFL